MPVLKIVNMAGKETGEITLSDAVFGAEVNATVLHTAVKAYLANQRQGTQSTLTRTEVSGGGRKPWRQKGTGRARQGSTRSPQWTHGGVALGPKPRKYRMSVVVDSISAYSYKTKTMVNMLSAIGAGKKSLIVLADNDNKVVKSCANIEGVKTAPYNTVNVYDILNADTFVVAKEAAEKLEEVFA